MNRRAFLAGLGGLMMASPARADAPLDRVLRDLRRLGYDSITVSNTLLGRTRVFAEGASASREIILNPRTGEILRDLWMPKGASTGEGSGRLTGSDDDDDKDDDKDDDDRDDDGGGRGRGRGRGGDDD
jgi:hypothetical protein